MYNSDDTNKLYGKKEQKKTKLQEKKSFLMYNDNAKIYAKTKKRIRNSITNCRNLQTR